MAQLDKVLRNLIEPMVNDKEKLDIRVSDASDDHEVILCVYAANDDIARLIGKKGMMATALRQVMSVASHRENKRIYIQFEQI